MNAISRLVEVSVVVVVASALLDAGVSLVIPCHLPNLATTINHHAVNARLRVYTSISILSIEKVVRVRNSSVYPADISGHGPGLLNPAKIG